MSKVIKINNTNPAILPILITMIQNYKKNFKEYKKTSKNNGFVSDDLVEQSIESIEYDLSQLLRD